MTIKGQHIKERKKKDQLDLIKSKRLALLKECKDKPQSKRKYLYHTPKRLVFGIYEEFS